MKLLERISRSVKTRRGNVVLRADFLPMGSQSQITEALKSLQKKGALVRIGTGLYAKTRISSVTGAVIPAGSLESLSLEALEKLGVEVRPSKAADDYNAGRTTQIPGTLIVNTGRKRIRRKITVGGRNIAYENDIERTMARA
jgi:predicted transcriptional regulator of viral defense system